MSVDVPAPVMALSPDRLEAERYIAALAGSEDAVVTFQTYDDNPKRKSKALAAHFSGTLQTHWHRLVHANRSGAGIFVMVNEGDLRGRSEENVVRLRALFVDDDGGQLDPGLVAPPGSLVVQGKRGCHIYWLLHGGEPLGRFTPAQVVLATTYGTDPGVKDLPRVMRVPGFFHLKDAANPFLVRVVGGSGDFYTVEQIMEGKVVPTSLSVPAPPRNVPVFDDDGRVRRARAYLDKVPPAIEGEQGDNKTYRVAAALVRDFGLDEGQAMALLMEWNVACSPPWTEAELRKKIENGRKYGSHPVLSALASRRSAAAVPAPEPDSPWPDDPPPDIANDAPPMVEEETPPPPAIAQTPTGWNVGGFVFTRIGIVEEEPIEWLFDRFIPFADLTDLSSDPGVGKSSILASLCAAVTTGRVLPSGEKRNEPATAILFATEDRLGATLKSRLRAEGADLNRVLVLDIRKLQDWPCFPADAALIERFVLEVGAKFVGLDPCLDFMGADLDAYKQQEVSRFMRGLAGIGQRTGAAVVSARHNNKTTGTKAIYKGGGSIGFASRARMALTAGKDGATGRRVLAVVKGALGKDTHAINYDIVDRDGSSVVAWGDVSMMSADELVNQEPGKKPGPKALKIEAAKDFILDLLTSEGPLSVRDVIERAKAEADIGRNTVYDAAGILLENRIEKITVGMRQAWRVKNGIPNGS